MLAKEKKGANNADTTAAVAKARTQGIARGQTGATKRKGSAGIPVGTHPVRYKPIRVDWDEAKQRPSPAVASAQEQRPAQVIPAGYQGPSIKVLTRLAAIGLVLTGFVLGVVVGKALL